MFYWTTKIEFKLCIKVSSDEFTSLFNKCLFSINVHSKVLKIPLGSCSLLTTHWKVALWSIWAVEFIKSADSGKLLYSAGNLMCNLSPFIGISTANERTSPILIQINIGELSSNSAYGGREDMVNIVKLCKWESSRNIEFNLPQQEK